MTQTRYAHIEVDDSVYAPQHDSWLLSDALHRADLAPGKRGRSWRTEIPTGRSGSVRWAARSARRRCRSGCAARWSASSGGTNRGAR